MIPKERHLQHSLPGIDRAIEYLLQSAKISRRVKISPVRVSCERTMASLSEVSVGCATFLGWSLDAMKRRRSPASGKEMNTFLDTESRGTPEPTVISPRIQLRRLTSFKDVEDGIDSCPVNSHFC